MISNKLSALSRLAEISGATVADFRRNVPVALGGREYDLRGEIVTAEFLSSPKIAFCPACLHEDDQAGERRSRWTWSFAVVRTCPAHQIALQSRVKASWNDSLQSLTHVVPEKGEALQALAAASAHRAPSPLQDYVLARLEGNAGPQWLDEQTLDQAVRATELLGVLLEFGPTQLLPELTEAEWDRAGRVGFHYTSQGEVGVRQALQEQFDRFSNAKGSPGPRKIFGCFYNALAHSKSMKNPGDIARIVREFMWDHIPMPAGRKVLGAILEERRLHTVASLAKETGHDARRLRNMLVAEGVIPGNAVAHFPIPVEKGREVAARVKRIVDVIRLPEVLHCTRPLASQLLSDRLLTPIFYQGSRADGGSQQGVDSEEISHLLRDLEAKAPLVGKADADLVRLSKASEKAKLPGSTIVQLILAGYLKRVVRVENEPGIGGLRLCPAEVKKTAEAVLVGIGATHAFAALTLPVDAGWELAGRSGGDVSLMPFKIIGPDPAYPITRFLPEIVTTFEERFTTLAHVAKRDGIGVRTMKDLLKKVGVKPLLKWREVGADIYRTSDIAKVLPA
ncbi:hypothetical protein ATO5_07345 [Loktanella sp. 22II-4b]|nr:hypothetical protein ATO5_07345 [Loktanella sp. 22II-4b]